VEVRLIDNQARSLKSLPGLAQEITMDRPFVTCRFLLVAVALTSGFSTAVWAEKATGGQDEIGYRPVVEVPFIRIHEVRPLPVREIGSPKRIREYDPSRFRGVEVPQLKETPDTTRLPSKTKEKKIPLRLPGILIPLKGPQRLQIVPLRKGISLTGHRATGFQMGR
jgi:hypothetical protein